MSFFKPAGPFARQSTGGTKQYSSKKYPSDHLVTIQSIDPVAHKVVAMNSDGKVNVYQINAAAFARGQIKAGYVAKRAGNRIDEFMAKDFPVGHKVVVEKAVETQFKAAGGLKVFEGNWIHNATQQDESKLFTGLFTVTRKKDVNRLASIQRWDEQAHRVGDKEFIISFAEKLEIDYAEFLAGKKLPRRGFQLRTMKKDGDQYVCIDSTEPFNNIKIASEDGEAQYTPITRDFLVGICKQYKDYLVESYPTLKEDGCVIEIMTFISYFASKESSEMTWEKDWMSIAKMTERVSKRSADDNGYNGRNTGVRGILELTADDDKIVNKQMILCPRDIAQRFYANNSLWDVRTMVDSFDGCKVRLADYLKVEVAKNYDNQDVKYKVETLVELPKSKFPDTSWPADADESDPFAGSDESDPFA